MKITWAAEYKEIWDKVASLCKTYGVQIFAGDFNMALLHVPTKLSSRGLQCDCIAWTPWLVDPRVELKGYSGNQRLGFESVGVFYIEGKVEAWMPWGI